MCAWLYMCQPGNYYIFNGGVNNSCPYTPCTNASFGQQYTPGYTLAEDECPVKDCPNNPAPAGFFFGSAGSCELSRCATGKPGTFYTRGCNLGRCTNGNVRYVENGC